MTPPSAYDPVRKTRLKKKHGMPFFAEDNSFTRPLTETCIASTHEKVPDNKFHNRIVNTLSGALTEKCLTSGFI